MAVGSIYRVSLVGIAQFNQELVNVFHYRAEQPTVFDTQAEDLAQAVSEFLVAPHAAARSVGTAATLIEVRGVTNPTEGFDLNIDPNVSGGIAGDALPPQAAAVITWTTGLVGRRFRGRTFMWPAGEGSQAGGVYTEAYLALMDAFADEALLIGSGILTATYQLVVHSVAGGTNTPVTGHISRNTVHTQKRRVLGIGS